MSVLKNCDVCVTDCGLTCVTVRGQRVELVLSFYCGFQELNSGCQAWGQVLLLAEHLASPYSMVSEKDCLARSNGKLLLSSMQETEAGGQ